MVNQQVNLYQPVFRREHKLLSFDTLLQIYLICIIAFGVVFAYGLWTNHNMHQSVNSLRTLQQDKLALLDEVNKQILEQKQSGASATELDQLQQELLARQYLTEALEMRKKAFTLGFSQYLEIFSRKMLSGMWLTGFSVAGGGEGLELQGGSLDPKLIPQFVEGLADVNALANVEFNLLEIERESPNRKWVEFILNTGTTPLEAFE